MDAPKHTFLAARDSVSRQGNPIQLIVVHATAGTNSLDWLRGNVRGTSIHILIDKTGNAFRLVMDDRGANHAGFSEVTIGAKHFGRARGIPSVNEVSLGIELENRNDGEDRYPDAQLLTCAEWIVYWRSVHGNLPIYFHREIDTQGKSDPKGVDHKRLQAFIDRVLGQKKTKDTPIEDASWAPFNPSPRAGILNDNSSVRQGPGRVFPRATIYPKGTRVLLDGTKKGEVIGEDGRWFHLENGLGFIHASLVDVLPCVEEVKVKI